MHEQCVAGPNGGANHDGGQERRDAKSMQYTKLSMATRKLIRNVGIRAFPTERPVVERPVDGQSCDRTPNGAVQTAAPNAENNQRKRSQSGENVDAGDCLERLEARQRSRLSTVNRSEKDEAGANRQRRCQLRGRQDRL